MSRQDACLQRPPPDDAHAGRMRLIVGRKKMWAVGQTVTVSFFNDPTQDESKLHPKTPRYRQLVEHYGRIWERWANLKFKFLEDNDEAANIKITSMKKGSDSAVGTDANHPYYKKHGTMNLDLDPKDPPIDYSRAVSHEFGHAIGCEHEQQNPNAPYHWIPENVVKWYETHTDWKKPTVDNAFNNFEPSTEAQGYESTAWDPLSIMQYHIEKSWTREGIVVERSKILSDKDKDWIGRKYPFDNTPVTGPGADKLLDRSSYAVVEAYEYKNAKMYLNVFCQSDSYSLYKLTYLFKHGSPKTLDPDWEVERIAIPLHGAAAPAPGTPLAAIRHNGGDHEQVVHLFYLDRNDYIRECVFVNGELKCTNKLNTKAASYSRLSAVTWQDGDQKQIRLFYQSARDDHIQEYIGVAKWDGTTAVTAWDMGAYVNIGDEYPLPGSDLSFVNLTWDSACIRGYYQNTDGAIKECSYTSGKWSLSPDWMIYNAPYATSFVAMVWDQGKAASHKPILYYKGREEASDDEQYIYKAVPAPRNKDAEKFCSSPIDRNSRMAFVVSSAGYRLFSTSEGKLVERISPGKGKSFESPVPMKFAWSSTLGHGDPYHDVKIIDPQGPGPVVDDRTDTEKKGKGPFGW